MSTATNANTVSAMNIDSRVDAYPDAHADFIARCHKAG